MQWLVTNFLRDLRDGTLAMLAKPRKHFALSRRAMLAGTGICAARCALGRDATGVRTNLLFLITDQQRWDALGCAGNRVLKTPNLDRLAREGVRFETAMTPCPVCAPARASILTGCGMDTTGVRSNFDAYREGVRPPKTFDEALAAQGYALAYHGKWHAPLERATIYPKPIHAAGMGESPLGLGLGAHYQQYVATHVPPREPGEGELLDPFSGRPYTPHPLDRRYGLAHGEELEAANGDPVQPGQPDFHGCLDLPAEYSITAMQAGETIASLELLQGVPFSITCAFHGPHAPMLPCPPYCEAYPPEEMELPLSLGDTVENSPYRHSVDYQEDYAIPAKIRYMISEYYGLVSEIDDWVGRILDRLRDLGLEERTLVVFTSDHGEMLGAHGMREKNVFYEESVRVPLLLRLPGRIPAGKTVATPVSLVDLYATILDYLGASGHPSEGRSLRDLIEGNASARPDFVVSEWDSEHWPAYMVRTAEWKLLFGRTPDAPSLDALYDLKNDPYEMRNLIGNDQEEAPYLGKAEELKARLVSWLEAIHSPYVETVRARELR